MKNKLFLFKKSIFIGLFMFLFVPFAAAQANEPAVRDTLFVANETLHFSSSISEYGYMVVQGYHDCTILAFELTHISQKKGDAATIRNKSGRFESKTQALFQKAEPGDTYIISNIIAYKTETKEKVKFPIIVIIAK